MGETNCETNKDIILNESKEKYKNKSMSKDYQKNYQKEYQEKKHAR